MPEKITITVPVKITVDLDAWATTYGLASVGLAALDAHNHIPHLIREHVGTLPHIAHEHTLTLEA